MVRIVEVRQLVGNDIDPFVQVTVGQQTKTTKTKRSTNDAVFEEVKPAHAIQHAVFFTYTGYAMQVLMHYFILFQDFVFEFSLPKVVFLQNIISITVITVHIF